MKKISKFLANFLLAILLAGCTTSSATIPQLTPTATPNQENNSLPITTQQWQVYADTLGRFSISYPNNWLINSQVVSPNSLSITTIFPNKPSQSESKQSTELDIKTSDFFIVINIDPNVRLANNAKLLEWVKENDPGRGNIISINETKINEYQAVEKIVQVTRESTYRTIYFSTQSGLIQIIAENIDSPDATYLGDILLTLKIDLK